MIKSHHEMFVLVTGWHVFFYFSFRKWTLMVLRSEGNFPNSFNISVKCTFISEQWRSPFRGRGWSCFLSRLPLSHLHFTLKVDCCWVLTPAGMSISFRLQSGALKELSPSSFSSVSWTDTPVQDIRGKQSGVHFSGCVFGLQAFP